MGIEDQRLHWQRILNHVDGIWVTHAGADAAAELLMSRQYVGVGYLYSVRAGMATAASS